MTSKCSIQEFIRELRSLSRPQFTLEGVHEFLRKHPIDPSSLEKYLFFRKSHYTRNLIDKSDLYEVLSICWEAGQKSQIHNHRGQNCWMAVPLGRLLVQNYRIVGGNDGTEHCELAESSRYWMDPSNPGQSRASRTYSFGGQPGGTQSAGSFHPCLLVSVRRLYGVLPGTEALPGSPAALLIEIRSS